MVKKILVVDDEKEICTFFHYFLKKKGYDVTALQSGIEAIETLKREKFHLALFDLKMPDSDGLTLLKKVKEVNPACQVIIMTGYSTIKSAITAMQNGALDYIEKPFDNLNQLENLIDGAFKVSHTPIAEELRGVAVESGLVLGINKQMLRVIDIARRIASKNVTVLLQGETGTGKEVIARFIHNCGSRAEEPFIPINCAALTENLLESELFGHEKGAFTGADRTRKGFFEIASSGIVFLDEIGEASLSTQAKLLRVLENGEYIRVGGEMIRKTNTRVIAATNIVLDQAVTNRAFRQDLFYRLDVLTLKIPPLRERREDIPLYLNHFLRRFRDTKETKVQRFAPETLEILSAYDWPGNLRELVNLVQWLVTVVDEPVVLPVHLQEKIHGRPVGQPGSIVRQLGNVSQELGEEAAAWIQRLLGHLQAGENLDLHAIMEDFTQLKNLTAKRIIEKALAKTLGDRKAAADMLGITTRTLKYIYIGK